MNKQNKTILTNLALESLKSKHPSFPINAIPVPKYTDKTANGLTKCVIDFLNLSGHQAERISSMGRMIDKRQKSTDVLGRERTIGSLTYIKGTSTNGTADISSIINGKSVKIEIKIGKDRQSEAQKKYQESTEKAGGIYLITKSFDEFMEQYKKLRAGTKLYNGFEIPETTIIHTSMKKRPFRIVCTVSNQIQFLDTGEFHYITANQMKHYL
jgi:hypothetical protein